MRRRRQVLEFEMRFSAFGVYTYYSSFRHSHAQSTEHRTQISLVEEGKHAQRRRLVEYHSIHPYNSSKHTPHHLTLQHVTSHPLHRQSYPIASHSLVSLPLLFAPSRPLLLRSRLPPLPNNLPPRPLHKFPPQHQHKRHRHHNRRDPACRRFIFSG